MSRVSITDSGRELLIRDLQLSDMGDYQCVGHNQAGEGVPAIHRLNITGELCIVLMPLFYQC